MRYTSSVLIVLGMFLVACTGRERSNTQPETASADAHQTQPAMKSPVSIVEIPAADFLRAKIFYESILGITIEGMDWDGMKLGLFPTTESGLVVQLVQSPDHKPSSEGAVIYLNGGNELQTIADRVQQYGGSLILPKTAIAPDMGFYALFLDSEGNKLGLYSPK